MPSKSNSMIWFGSSAGVAHANMYPEAKSAGRWLLHGWHVSAGLRHRFLCHAFGARLASRPAAQATGCNARGNVSASANAMTD